MMVRSLKHFVVSRRGCTIGTTYALDAQPVQVVSEIVLELNLHRLILSLLIVKVVVKCRKLCSKRYNVSLVNREKVLVREIGKVNLSKFRSLGSRNLRGTMIGATIVVVLGTMIGVIVVLKRAKAKEKVAKVKEEREVVD